MNKFLPTTGGHNLRLDEFKLMQDAYIDGFKALLLKLAPTGNAILDGVIIDSSGANIVQTSGYVTINTEIYKIDSNSFPKSLNPADVLYFKPVQTTITPSSPVVYEDTTSNVVHVERKAVLKYKDVSDTDGVELKDVSYPGGVLEGTIDTWFPPNGKVVADYFDNTGLGINSARGYAICNGANGTVDLRGFYLAQATNVPYAGFGSLSGLLDGITSNPGVAYGHNKIALTTPQIPSHTHGVNDPGHFHTYTTGSNAVDGWQGDSARDDFGPITANTQTKTTGITIQATGGGQSHDNMPATFPVYYIQKLRA